jgi:hypothetical protein
MLVNSGFHMQKNFSGGYSQFGHAPSRRFASLAGRKSVENSGLKGRSHVSVQLCKLNHFWFTTAIHLLTSFIFGPVRDGVSRKVDLNVQTLCTVASTKRITRWSVLRLLLKVWQSRLLRNVRSCLLTYMTSNPTSYKYSPPQTSHYNYWSLFVLERISIRFPFTEQECRVLPKCRYKRLLELAIRCGSSFNISATPPLPLLFLQLKWTLNDADVNMVEHVCAVWIHAAKAWEGYRCNRSHKRLERTT